MTGETLNEAIDRVAERLTAVPPDTGFSARMNERLDAAPSGVRAAGVGVGMAVIAAAAVVLVAVAGLRVDRETATHVPESAPVASVEQPRPSHTSRAVTASLRPETERVHRSRPTPPEAVSDSTVPAIAALVGPDSLDVNALTFESLSIAPVELEFLEMANLEMQDIDAGEPKEP